MTESTTDERAKAIEKAQEAMQQQRPLNVTQGRNLLRIVKNDFESLKANCKVMANEEIERREEEIRKGVNKEAVAELRDRAIKFANEVNDKMRKFHEEAAEKGLKIHYLNMLSSGHISVSDDEVQRKVNMMKNEVMTRLQRVLDVAESEFRKAERLVLLATVSSESEQILSGIPTAEQLMAQAYQEREDRRAAITSGQ